MKIRKNRKERIGSNNIANLSGLICANFYRILIAFCLLLINTGNASADGIFIPAPGDTDAGFSIIYHNVKVEIRDQAAVTEIEQVFRNEANRTREAIYIFPLPKGSAISEFSMYVGGEKVKGELLDSNEARRIYEDIVRRRRDPALLEYADRGLFRARIFPIAPREEKKVTLKYTELLHADNSTVQYLYPLNTEKFSSEPLDNVSIYIKLHSTQPVKNIYSPSHDVSIRRQGENSATISYEESRTKPDKDFTLYYSTSRDDVGMTLLTQPDDDGGYFILLASPRTEWLDKEIAAKDVVFVLDRTGSMSGDKIQQAKDALVFCIRALNPKDRFNVIAFDESTDNFKNTMTDVSDETVDDAVDFVRGIDAAGGTNIDHALREGMKQFKSSSDRPKYLIFLTDGLPTVGETNIERIIKNVRDENRARVRLFAFGVGYDVNTHLLDRLSEGNSGSVDYVKPEEDIEAKVSGFFRKVSYPV
ncbi:MAG: VIT domain-containing protein, partial [bacterium]